MYGWHGLGLFTMENVNIMYIVISCIRQCVRGEVI